jgi:beta-lactamase class C
MPAWRGPILPKFFRKFAGVRFQHQDSRHMLPRRPSLTKRSATLFIGVPLFSALLATSAITARPTMDTEVDHIISRGIAPMVAPNGAGGVAVVAQIGGRNLFFNYGFADLAEKRQITSDSLFNVGSVRKIFEATLVAQAVLRGELKLDEPVAKYVNELYGDYIRQITIGQLVSHTSGLLLPTDHAPWPEQHFSLAGFYDALNAWTPSGGEQPGKQRIYTHAGYVLLQLVLERRYGMPIATLIDRGVVAPLGLTSTIVPERGPDDRAIMRPELVARAVQGYSLHGEPIGLPGNQQSYFDFPGTGQMFSSARDLAILVAACLGERPLTSPASGAASARELREALQLTQREEFRVSAQYAQAMAWEIESPFGVTIIDKPGGLDNASAYIGLVPERKIGLVILANRGDVHPFEMARSTILPELARLQTPKPQALGSTARQ